MAISVSVDGTCANFFDVEGGKYLGLKEALEAIYRAVGDGAEISLIKYSDISCSLKSHDGYLLSCDEVYARFIRHALRDKANQVIVTTGLSISSINMPVELGIVSSHVVYGVNFIKDTLVDFTGTFGGRSETLENSFHQARVKATEELKLEAAQIGAKGVVAVKYDFSQLSNNMAHCSAVGTAIS